MTASVLRWVLSAMVMPGIVWVSSLARADEPIAQVLGGGDLSIYPKANGPLSFTVAGRGVWQRVLLAPGESAVFRPVDERGNALPDGFYRYELRVVDPASDGTSSDQALRSPEGSAPRPVQAGSFQMDQGSISILRDGGLSRGGAR